MGTDGELEALTQQLLPQAHLLERAPQTATSPAGALCTSTSNAAKTMATAVFNSLVD